MSTLPRSVLTEFIGKFCLDKPELTACAESAFYAFNQALAALSAEQQPTDCRDCGGMGFSADLTPCSTCNHTGKVASAPQASAEQPDYEALEREHLGDPDKRTGIYASPIAAPASQPDAAAIRRKALEDFAEHARKNYNALTAAFIVQDVRALATQSTAQQEPSREDLLLWIAAQADKTCHNCDGSGIFYGNVCLCGCVNAAPTAQQAGEPFTRLENELQAVVDKLQAKIITMQKELHLFRQQAGQPAPAVPEGYVIVPEEPTPKMIKAAADAWLDCGSKLILNKARAALIAGINAAPAQEGEKK